MECDTSGSVGVRERGTSKDNLLPSLPPNIRPQTPRNKGQSGSQKHDQNGTSALGPAVHILQRARLTPFA